MGKSLYQTGGPIGVNSGASTGAITFGLSFPDASYVVSLEWVSGAPPQQGVGIRAKTVDSCIAAFYGNTSNSAFIWSAWRI